MTISELLRKLAKGNGGNRNERLRRLRRQQKRRTLMEPLEVRRVLTTFFVDTLFDESFDGGDTAAETADGGGLSFREAIGLANANAGGTSGEDDGDVIEFTVSGIHELTLGQLEITDDVIINGNVNEISGGNASRVLHIDTSGAPGATAVVINSLAISNGLAEFGGGVFISDGEDVTISTSVIGLNEATEAGGGIYNGDGTLRLDGFSSVFGNTAATDGGGIFNDGGFVVIDSSFITSNEAGQSGGGIFNAAGGSVTVENGSEVNENSAASEGGGLWNGSGLMTIDGVLINNNSAAGNGADQGGGGVFNAGGTVEIIGGSITNNLASGATTVPLQGSQEVPPVTTTATGEARFQYNALTETFDLDLFVTGLELVDTTADPELTMAHIHVGEAGENGPVIVDLLALGSFVEDDGGLRLRLNNEVFPNANVADLLAGNTYFNVHSSANPSGEVRGQIGFPATMGSGGGILNDGGTLNVNGTFIGSNIASRAGGGIESNLGEVNLAGVTLESNVAGPDGLATPGNGGGLHVSGASDVHILGGVVDGNIAAAEGGGLWNSGLGTLTIGDSTAASVNTIREATGPNRAGIQAAVDAFRDDLGTLNPNEPVTFGQGRRQINWDAAPDSVSAPNDFPGDFFNAAFEPRARGIEFETFGSGFQLSATDVSGEGIEFNNINPTYSDDFATFSSQRLFTPLGDNVTEISFFVPGTDVPAVVSGFGAVFSDVDLEDTTRLEFFDSNFNLIAERSVLATPGDQSLSFAGVSFDSPVIALVTITTGNAALGAGIDDDATHDLVVMDDFIFGEPVPFATNITANTASGAAADQGGGGVFNDGGVVNINNADISFNTVDGTAGSGGGILNDGGTLNIANTTIESNDAIRAGGGIEITTANARDSVVTLNEVRLTSNNVGGPPGNGGGLHVTDPLGDNSSMVEWNGGSVGSNFAASEGGGLWNDAGGTMTINGTEISNNTASGDAADQGGGGVFNNGGTVNISDAFIARNTADGASGSGGGILNDGGTLTIEGTSIENNSAIRAGGGIEITTANLRDSNVTLTNVSLEFNSTGASPGNGGGLHVTDPLGDNSSDVQIDGGSVISNIANREGGGLWNDAGGTMTIHGTSISGNTANGSASDQGGGGIFNNGGVLIVSSANIDSNLAASNGGGLFSEGGTMTVSSSQISNNNAVLGGGLFAVDGVVAVSSSTIAGNTADQGGGGIFNNGGVLIVSSANIDSNMAASNGGGLFSEGGTMTVSSSQISNNNAVLGGGLFAVDGVVAVSSSTIAGNTADQGGGVYHNSGGLTLVNTTVSGNEANEDGGGLFNLDAAGLGLTVTNSTIAGNIADADGDTSGEGGGIYTDAEPGVTALFNTIVAGNQLGIGGADGPSDIEGEDVLDTSANNLVGDPATAGGLTEGVNLVGDGAGTLLPVDQIVDPILRDNGGPTLTHALVPDSRALDNGDDGLISEPADQRGAPFVRVFGASVDIGAVEDQTFGPEAFVVTTTALTLDLTDGEVSLPEALAAAEFNPGPDEITFGGTVFTDSTPDTITLDGQLVITTELTITGPGADLLTISGNDQSRIFSMTATATDVTLSGMTLSGGNHDGDGGAINNQGSLTLDNMVITGNTATDDGGGVYNDGTLTVTSSTISGNSTDDDGGGIANEGTLTVTDSTISDNSASENGGGIGNDGTLTVTSSTISGNSTDDNGGGIDNGGTLTITDSTISDNSASDGGGGIYSDTSETVMLVNSTVSNNSAAADGGGIQNYEGTLIVSSSTITANRSDADGDGGGTGGGIWTYDDGVTFTELFNTIVAGNLAGDVGGEVANDLAEKDVESSSANNLIGDPGSAGGLVDGTDGNLVGQDDGNGGRELLDVSTVLGPLADNGGSTLTHLLINPKTNPAIDSGDSALLPAGVDTDQIGNPRVNDVPSIDNFDGGLDIGSVEFVDITAPVVTPPADLTLEGDTAGGADPAGTELAAFLSGATAVDDVDDTLTITNDAPAVFPVGDTTVTFTSVDTAGNIGTTTAVVSVTDTIAPTLTVPADITVEGDTAGGADPAGTALAAFLAAATATDIVDSDVAITTDAPDAVPRR